MKRIPIDLAKHLPIGRDLAAHIANEASKYKSTLTLECSGVVLNLKSMIGLLSQSIPKDGKMMIVANGEDENQAAEDMLDLFR